MIKLLCAGERSQSRWAQWSFWFTKWGEVLERHEERLYTRTSNSSCLDLSWHVFGGLSAADTKTQTSLKQVHMTIPDWRKHQDSVMVACDNEMLKSVVRVSELVVKSGGIFISNNMVSHVLKMIRTVVWGVTSPGKEFQKCCWLIQYFGSSLFLYTLQLPLFIKKYKCTFGSRLFLKYSIAKYFSLQRIYCYLVIDFEKKGKFPIEQLKKTDFPTLLTRWSSHSNIILTTDSDLNFKKSSMCQR